MMETLVFETKHSYCYKENYIFRKYIKYNDSFIVNREYLYAKIAYDNGIKTPKPINKGYSNIKNLMYIEYEWADLIRISEFDITDKIFNDIFKLSEKIKIIEGIKSDDFWVKNRLPEMILKIKVANNILKEKDDIDLVYLQNLKPVCFIHGDYSESNICLNRTDDLYITDFENACMGPNRWDICYFLASYYSNKEIPEFIKSYLSDEDLRLIKIIAKIRYGRAITKNMDHTLRLEAIYRWNKFIL